MKAVHGVEAARRELEAAIGRSRELQPDETAAMKSLLKDVSATIRGALSPK